MRPIDRAARTQIESLTVGHAGADAPRCHDCGDRLPQASTARATAERPRAGDWQTRLYCSGCGEVTPERGVDQFCFAVSIRAGTVGATVRPPLMLADPRIIARSLAGAGATAGRDPATTEVRR